MAKEDEKVSENIEETAGNTEESTENVAKETQLDTKENELNIFADQLKEKLNWIREKNLLQRKNLNQQSQKQKLFHLFSTEKITDSLMMLRAKSESTAS